MLQPCQAYHTLTYESQWKAEIDREWDALNVAWTKEHPGIPLKKTQFEFMNSFIREKYEAESPEMKQRVEEFRCKLAEKPLDDANRDFQASVFCLLKETV